MMITMKISTMLNMSLKVIEPNYQVFFILGIFFLPMGIVLMITIDNPAFIGITGMGLIYMVIGLANRDKWKKNE